MLNITTCSKSAFLLTWCLFTSAASVKAPALIWLLYGSIIGLFFLQVPVYLWVSASVLAATISRFLVAIGIAPSMFNFFHFPLAMGAVFLTATEASSQFSVARNLAIGVLFFLILCYASWMMNSGEIYRPFLNWIVFCEPFLLIYAIVNTNSSSDKDKFLWNLALSIIFIQFPLAIWQAFTLGLADTVQGTFVGMGAGHHVMGAITLIGTLICLSRSLSADSFKMKLTWLIPGILIFIPSVLSDAKQAIAGFLPALFLVIFPFLRFRLRGVLLALPFLFVVILKAFSYYQPLQMIVNLDIIKIVILIKKEIFTITANHASENPWGLLYGLGPGNTVSRIALMALDSYGAADSPLNVLGGLKLTSTTLELLKADPLKQIPLSSLNVVIPPSSVGTSISSWLGLFGDLGLSGLALYLWICWKLWQKLRKFQGWQTEVAKAAMLMAGLLGFVFSWLEEPGFTLIVALVVGLALKAGKKEGLSEQNSESF